MIERPSGTIANDERLRGPLRFGFLAALLALSACVSDADPRDDGPLDGRSGADVRDAGAGDSARRDGQDSSVPEDGDDDGGSFDAVDAVDERAMDAAADLTGLDAGDAGDALDSRAPDAMDVVTDPPVADSATDLGTSDGDAGVDATDVSTGIDVSDAGAPIDVSDAGAPGDASDVANDGDATVDAVGDASDGAADGGVVVFYREDFTSTLGTFSPQTVCMTPAQWSSIAEYAHASEPILPGVSRITNQPVIVPANTSNIALRMSHKFDTEEGFDAGQLLISVNGAAATQVTTFVTGGYMYGGATNPTSCMVTNTRGSFPGWSGNQAEWISEVNLSAAPFNVVAGNTITISFRMTTDIDTLSGGNGWDINWVTLSGTSP